jgi:hypothetical protein
MRITDIREKLSNGFEPFLLRLADGRRIEVPQPDFIAAGKHVVVVLDRNDAARKIDVLHIVSTLETAGLKIRPPPG